MDEWLAPYLDWLASHGIGFEVDQRLFRDADHDGVLIPDPAPERVIALDGVPPIRECRRPETGLAADHATLMVARTLLRDDLPFGDGLCDIGCGTGVLAVAAALAGARRVCGTDVDPRAVGLARCTAAAAGVEATFRVGSLLDPLPEGTWPATLVANLPHKPVPDDYPLGPGQNGGPTGAEVHREFVRQAAGRLAPGVRIVFFLHSLPDPGLLLEYAGCCDLTLLAWKLRYLQPGEYGGLEEYFAARARAGRAYLVEREGRRILVAGVWRARLR